MRSTDAAHLPEWLTGWTRNPLGNARKGLNLSILIVKEKPDEANAPFLHSVLQVIPDGSSLLTSSFLNTLLSLMQFQHVKLARFRIITQSHTFSHPADDNMTTWT